MPARNKKLDPQALLRTEAEGRLQSGTAPAMRGWLGGAQALALLHKLASEPDSAGEALKLLHELQVHQVELDLQQEQIENDRRLFSEALEGYAVLFEDAPFAYFTLEPDGRLIEANRIGEAWLGVERSEWASHRVQNFFAADHRVAVRDALQRLAGGGACEYLEVQTAGGVSDLKVAITAVRGGRPVLLALMPISPPAQPLRPSTPPQA